MFSSIPLETKLTIKKGNKWTLVAKLNTKQEN